MSILLRNLAIPAAASAAFHAWLILGFCDPGAPGGTAPPAGPERPALEVFAVTPEEEERVVRLVRDTPPRPDARDVLRGRDIATTVTDTTVFVMAPEPWHPPGPDTMRTHLPPVILRPGESAGDGGGDIVAKVWLDNDPRARFQPSPVYPRALKDAGVEGSVEIEFVVEKDGSVSNPRVVASTNRGFEASALQAIRRWRFEPGMKGTSRVRFRMAQAMIFRLGR